MGQTFLTSHGSPYLLRRVDGEWAGGRAAGGRVGEKELWMKCKMKSKNKLETPLQSKGGENEFQNNKLAIKTQIIHWEITCPQTQTILTP